MGIGMVGSRGIEPLAATTPHFYRNGFTVRHGEGSPQGLPGKRSRIEGVTGDTAIRPLPIGAVDQELQ